MSNFNSEVIALAQNVERKYNVPASVTLGAYAIESCYGSSDLAKKNNNYFGITQSGDAGYTLGANGRKWAKYSSMEASFNAFGKLLSNDRYSALTKNAKSIEEYVRSYADTYAPPSDGNVSYADNLLKIISDNNLNQYNGGNIVGTVGTVETVSNIKTDFSGYDDLGTFSKIGFNVLYTAMIVLIFVGCLYMLYKSFSGGGE